MARIEELLLHNIDAPECFFVAEANLIRHSPFAVVFVAEALEIPNPEHSPSRAVVVSGTLLPLGSADLGRLTFDDQMLLSKHDVGSTFWDERQFVIRRIGYKEAAHRGFHFVMADRLASAKRTPMTWPMGEVVYDRSARLEHDWLFTGWAEIRLLSLSIERHHESSIHIERL